MVITKIKFHFGAMAFSYSVIIKGFYSNKISFYAEKAANLLIEIAENEEKVSHTILSMYEMDIS